ncbi:YjcQ family protein [Cloacibacillus evryensis]|uniref:YjcQ family protein n=1 Tax=Cloacibacillus evryensis TaxID=508460 RepID=UPI00210E2254|nr:YjcQ family protein [Cloacibacillus evryensis]MCQ4763241.1 hypothetical protein [Cloacibacillus evryensis]
MTLDAMNMVLYAIYTEYQKDLPDMETVNAKALGIEKDVFSVAIMKLENEGLISGALFSKELGPKYPSCVSLSKVMPTTRGLTYVSDNLEIKKITGKERTQTLLEKFKEQGWDALSDIAAKVLVEIGKQSIK